MELGGFSTGLVRDQERIEWDCPQIACAQTLQFPGLEVSNDHSDLVWRCHLPLMHGQPQMLSDSKGWVSTRQEPDPLGWA